ncbi:MAG: hypothetical protein EOO02_01720 [Chitinophagaceae bacterium]|nr:MAG: hypothetical protein EOO02_01720 [Chitinophagaceae bacterium]
MSEQNPKLDYQVPKPDERDYIFELSDHEKDKAVLLSATSSVFQLPVIKIESQGQLGSCTSFGLTTNLENIIYVVTGDTTYQASALFNYTQSLILDSVDLDSDPGTTVRSACGNLRLSGSCREKSWPYNDQNRLQIPTEAVYEEAFKLARLITYFEVKRDPEVIKYILMKLRFFILIGFQVYPSYQTQAVQDTGDIPFPTDAERAAGPIGGHCFNIIGFDDTRQVYIVVNNYGTTWGQQGYGSIPYAYFEDRDLVPEAKLLLPSEDFSVKYEQAMRSLNVDNIPEKYSCADQNKNDENETKTQCFLPAVIDSHRHFSQ